MTKFAIYQQFPPRRNESTGETEANLSRCGTLYAVDADEAIKKAYLLQAFANAQGGARFPVVEPL